MESTVIPTPSTSAAEQQLLAALADGGFRLHDGWFYPAGGPDKALVRFSVFSGQYQIWRRVKVGGTWMLIVTADVEDFDQAAFDTWRTSWPLSCR